MAQDYKLDSIGQELNLYLAASARKNAFISKPLILRAEFKSIPVVFDSERRVYEIDMAQLASFKDHFNDKQCKYVRLHDWDFNLKFQGKKCKSIELNCQHVALITTKTNKKQIKDCNFSLAVANQEAIGKLGTANAGYLNRLGKRNLVVNSEYVAEQHFALLNYVRKPLNFNAVQKIGVTSAKKQIQVDPMTYLNPRGKQLLQKLRHFITRENLLDFVVNQQLSQDGEKKMRKIILSDVFGQSKKKTNFSRNIIEALQKNLHD